MHSSRRHLLLLQSLCPLLAGAPEEGVDHVAGLIRRHRDVFAGDALQLTTVQVLPDGYHEGRRDVPRWGSLHSMQEEDWNGNRNAAWLSVSDKVETQVRNSSSQDAVGNSNSDDGDTLPAPLLGDAPSELGNQKEDRLIYKSFFIPLGVVFSIASFLMVAGFGYLRVLQRRCAVKTIPDEGSNLSSIGPSVDPGVAPGEHGNLLPDKVRYSYCLPTVATLPVSALVAVFLMSFYSRRGGDLPTMALAVALARSFDVISDPVMSYITDSCRHVVGRRKPFLIVGAPLYGLFMCALFSPPYLPPSPLAMWFAIMYVGFFLVNTFSNIPYDALGPELTEDSSERARLFFLSGIFDGGGTLLAFGLPFAGFDAAKMMGFTNSVCVKTSELVDKCASGFNCASFNSNGYGYEFVRNVSYAHQQLAKFKIELEEYDCDLAEPKIIASSGLEARAIGEFCSCTRLCHQACASANRAYGFMFTGLFFGLWYLITCYTCCHVVQERPPPPGGRRKTAPLVPSMLKALQNPAFSALLPAWACDAVSAAIFLALCPYYVMYVIAPEYQTAGDSPFGVDCLQGARGVSTSKTYDRRCNTMVVLGSCVTAALIAAIASTPLWLYGVRRFGKIKMWLAWSLTMAVTNFMFLPLTRSSIISCFAVCAVNGLPIAAKFLADAILADIIDYDEFLTGTRNEATYTMFKSFLPKIMAIPAAALPLAIMNSCGHIPADNGKVMLQPTSVVISVRVMLGGCSGVGALFAWYLKTKYPLKTDEQLEIMAEGIRQHREGKAAPDPVTGKEYAITAYTDEENECGVWRLDHFVGVQVVQEIADNPSEALPKLTSRCFMHFLLAILLVIVSVCSLVGSAPLLKNKELGAVPTVCAVFMGVSFVFLGFSALRWRAAREMQETPPSSALLAKVLEHRRVLQALADARRSQPPADQAGDQPEEHHAAQADSLRSAGVANEANGPTASPESEGQQF
mmetsp:Transcript_12540/g.24463  ORF Transcript_12540/g.24463 Transcript_12540/m.24463 type:complete len:968 (+) Transcript_12540:118-3021(+)